MINYLSAEASIPIGLPGGRSLRPVKNMGRGVLLKVYAKLLSPEALLLAQNAQIHWRRLQRSHSPLAGLWVWGTREGEGRRKRGKGNEILVKKRGIKDWEGTGKEKLDG